MRQNTIKDSASEQIRKALPRGDCNWPGYDYVQAQLQKACQTMAKGTYTHLSDRHVETMAVLGTGHEETMKAQLLLCRNWGFVD